MAMSIDPKAFYKISYGLYVISSRYNEKYNGQIANTVFQVTSQPPTVAVSINKQNFTHDFIFKSKIFSISVLSQDTPMEFIGRFGFKSGRDFDKFNDISFRIGDLGTPIVLDNCLSFFEVSLENHVDVGTHTVFIGRVLNSGVLKDGESMTYSYYQKVKNGLSPRTAPTYLEIRKEQQSSSHANKYRCSICGYIYDPQNGDQENNIKPGTAFVELPQEWKCPICNAGKDKFIKI